MMRRPRPTIVRRPCSRSGLLTVAGRLGLAAGKGAILAIIVWFVASKTLESKASPYIVHVTIGAGVAFVLATIYFVIWPSPFGDPRGSDEIFQVPPLPAADERQRPDETKPRS